MCLPWGADLRLWHSCWMSTIQDARKMWLATVTLLTVWWKMLSLGSRLQEPLAFILVSVPGCVLEPFVRKFLFFFFFFSEWFGLLCHTNSLRLFSRNSGPILTLRTNDAANASLPSSHSMVAYMSFWATYPLAVVVRHVFCGFVFLFFFLLVMLPSEIPNSPNT